LTVTATSKDGQTHTSSVPYTVAAPPTSTVSVPSVGGVYGLGASVAESFSCTEGIGGPGISSCLDGNQHPSGALLDTSSAGPHTLTVTATSKDGQTATASVAYTVEAPTAPTATLVARTVTGTHARLLIACGAGVGQCTLTGSLTVTEKLNGGKIVAVTAKAKTRTVTLASGTVTIPANASGTLSLTLSKAGSRLLTAHHTLTTRLTVAQRSVGTSVVIAKRTLTFKTAKTRKKPQSRR
jgi:hypothetical protein